MGLRGDIGIHAHRKSRRLTKLRRTRCQQLQFAGAFHVEKQDTGLERKVDFFRQLPDSGEDNITRGFPANLLYSLQFAAGDDIESSAHLSEQSQDRKIVIGLYRIADRVLAPAERPVELLVALANRRSGVNVQRRAILPGQLAERNSVGVHLHGGFAKQSLASAVGECRWSLWRTVSFHFLEEVPFTLMATMV